VFRFVKLLYALLFGFFENSWQAESVRGMADVEFGRASPFIVMRPFYFIISQI